MAFVHQKHKVVHFPEHGGKRIPQRFVELVKFKLHICAGKYLAYIEDENIGFFVVQQALVWVEAQIIISIVYLRRGEVGKPHKHVFGMGGVKFGAELVVNGDVRGENKEIPVVLVLPEIVNGRAHKPGFADAGGKREAERRETCVKLNRLCGAAGGGGFIGNGSQCGGFIIGVCAYGMKHFKSLQLRLA